MKYWQSEIKLKVIPIDIVTCFVKIKYWREKTNHVWHLTQAARAIYKVSLLIIEDEKIEITDLHSINIKSIYSLKSSLSHTDRTGKTNNIKQAVTTS